MKDELIALHDILDEIAFLRSIRERSTFDTCRTSSVDVRAASYSVMVISEAARRLPEDWLAAYPDMPWHAIRAIGNKLRHEYQKVSEFILWGIISAHSDVLMGAVEDMVDRHGQA